MKTRREFLRSTLLGVSTLWTVPGFVNQTMAALQQEALNTNAVKTGRDDRILVIVQLAGGNDGINTVIPYQAANYRRLRPKIAVPESQVRQLNEELGLHPSMSFLERGFKDGQVAIINGVGYPNPNRSHFQSTDIWSTANDQGAAIPHGWLGRYFDHECQGADPIRALSLTQDEPLMFKGIQRHHSNLSDLSQFAFNSLANDRLQDLDFRRMQSIDHQLEGETNRDFVQRVAMDTLVSSEQIRALASARPSRAYPNSSLGRQLSQVATMIEARSTTRFYYVSQGGYDTHTDQAGRHGQLLKELDDALGAFTSHMQQLKELDRVLVMTFSEFGRQLSENGTSGTDHGAAAPLFMIGGGIKPGFHFEYPSLRSQDLYANGDLQHRVDFRSVYSAILDQYLQAKPEKILGGTYPAPALFPKKA